MATAGTDTPALSRGLAVLRELAARPQGAGAADLARVVGAPRATLYRLLRTLIAEDFVRADPRTPGRYLIGPAIARMAGGGAERDLVAIARPAMDALAASLGETVKLVVRDGLEALTAAVSVPERDSCIASRPGARLPLYVGASQRLLLAHAPPDVQRRVLEGPLRRIASRTITQPRRLRAELDALATRREFASHGEGVEGVGAAAALVGASDAEPRAALVAVYVHASQNVRRLAEIRRETIAAATAITRELAAG
jgi:IclR family acetate operon transcriptional repressor